MLIAAVFYHTDPFFNKPLSLEDLGATYHLNLKDKKCDRVYPWI